MIATRELIKYLETLDTNFISSQSKQNLVNK